MKHSNNHLDNEKLAQALEDEHDGLAFEVIEREDIHGKKQIRRGVYLVPNLITSLSMLSAFFSIISSSHGDFYKAAVAIFLS